MGESTAMTQPSAAVKPLSPRAASKLHGVDIPLTLAVITMLAFGLLMVYSASWQYSFSLGQSFSYLFSRQVIWATIGIGAAIAISYIDYHKFKRLVVPVMYGTLFMLILVLFFFGETRWGSKRGLIGGSIQPTELAKLAIIVYLSFWIYSKQEVLNKITFGLLPLTGILGITAGLILGEPDISAAATIIFLGGVLFFIGGGDLKQIVMVLVIAALLGSLIVSIYPTGRARLNDYIAGARDPQNATYQVKRSMEAIVRGGVFGVGIGQSSTKFTGLPVPPTDSIFAVIVEETGSLGAAFVIGLYLVIVWRGIRIARDAPDPLGKMLAGGVTAWLFFEAFINMAAMVNLIPFAGNTLPLISAGGSSLVTTLAGVGILMSVNRVTTRSSQTIEGRSTSAVVDLRRGNRRRSVSRSIHSTSSQR